ncbi:RrF2 family transcriptional regulator [Slackia heliotrinireducens]|uniref:RrF2 family transcriptional regulator n=1 Tax=Slackia heliotrinireducens TaxID=84110 RepID=UPI0033163616
MLFSTRSQYALSVMVDLAERQAEGYTPLKEIADRQGISEKYLESILKVLVKNGFLIGVRGKGGGYKLTRNPDLYTVGDVLRLTEDSLTQTVEASQSTNEKTAAMWRGLGDAINGYLDSVTVADLATPSDAGDYYVI